MRPVSFLPFAIALATALPAAAGPLIDADSLETRLQDSDLAIIDIRNDIDGGFAQRCVWRASSLRSSPATRSGATHTPPTCS